jgi:catechol 2,3-dioxygenase-like lactoylglutathione lyase family enzyme
MTQPDGMTLTFFLVVGDQQRSRDWYRDVLGARVTRQRDPVVIELAGATVILNDGGPPTPDRPGVTLAVPDDPSRTSAFLNLRVGDIAAVHHRTTAAGARWLTPPADRGPEVRGYLRDPDGHLIEIGQATGR